MNKRNFKESEKLLEQQIQIQNQYLSQCGKLLNQGGGRPGADIQQSKAILNPFSFQPSDKFISTLNKQQPLTYEAQNVRNSFSIQQKFSNLDIIKAQLEQLEYEDYEPATKYQIDVNNLQRMGAGTLSGQDNTGQKHDDCNEDDDEEQDKNVLRPQPRTYRGKIVKPKGSETQQQRSRRLFQNKKSAQKCRLKKALEFEELSVKYENLQQENLMLQQGATKLNSLLMAKIQENQQLNEKMQLSELNQEKLMKQLLDQQQGNNALQNVSQSDYVYNQLKNNNNLQGSQSNAFQHQILSNRQDQQCVQPLTTPQTQNVGGLQQRLQSTMPQQIQSINTQELFSNNRRVVNRQPSPQETFNQLQSNVMNNKLQIQVGQTMNRNANGQESSLLNNISSNNVSNNQNNQNLNQYSQNNNLTNNMNQSMPGNYATTSLKQNITPDQQLSDLKLLLQRGMQTLQQTNGNNFSNNYQLNQNFY